MNDEEVVNMWQDYRIAKEKIKAPKLLKNEMLQKMNDMDYEVGQEPRLHEVDQKPMFYLAKMLCSVILATMGIVLIFTNVYAPTIESPNIETDSEATWTFEEIEDNVDDSIYQAISIMEFHAQGQQVVIRPPTSDSEYSMLANFEEGLGVRVSQLSFGGFTLSGFSWGADELDGNQGAHVRYFFVREGQRAEVKVNTESLTLLTNSLFGDQEIGLYVIDQYHIAVFEADGVFYQVVMMDVAQEAFVRYLWEMMNEIK